MLPFEDRFSRQRRLPEVGPSGQERLQRALRRAAPHPGLDIELDYLERAGAGEVVVDATAAAPAFPWMEWFEHEAALSVARGAWCALAQIKRELELTSH